MKASLAVLISTLTLLTNAHLTYDSQSKSIKCPAAAGTYCASTDLLVTCAGSVGSFSKCATGTTCSQSSADAGDASCSTTSKGSSITEIDDAASAECDCDEPHPPSSSTPVGPVIPSSTPVRPASTTPVGPAKVSSSPVHHGTGTSGMPRPTSKVTTLNSSWKPTLTASSSSRATSASPATQTTNAAASMNVNVAAVVGLAGFVAALL